jgi:putative Mn2+ efflux pump MntP
LVAKLIALIVPLGLDTFAVAAALGVAEIGAGGRARMSLVFPLFEAGMPLIGLALGRPIGDTIGGAADYVAAGVLLVLGVYMLLESEDEQRVAALSTRGWGGTLLLGISISLDELAIGFTLGLLRVPAGLVIALIAVQAFILTQVGLRLGARLNERLREAAERIAGLALAGLGVVLLAEKLIG